MPYSGRVDEILPMDADGHQPMNTDIAVTSDGAPADNGQHGNNIEEDTKGDVVANGQNTESSFENHSNGETDAKASSNDINVPPESNSDETETEE
ncbi:hypothetical protein C1H46_010023 [Malus baccata]|uniref:Uncharacterized protein n=1 Tax=Malus baccata TaxID=106549 RepID=A0A540N067_MALBA|nr:hypothetical protein C1H46_010023 [Malus baccata]